MFTSGVDTFLVLSVVPADVIGFFDHFGVQKVQLRVFFSI